MIDRKRSFKTFWTFAITIVSFGAGVVAMTWIEPTDALDLLSIGIFLFTAVYAAKNNFGKL